MVGQVASHYQHRDLSECADSDEGHSPKVLLLPAPDQMGMAQAWELRTTWVPWPPDSAGSLSSLEMILPQSV